jgi:hypothetical protein
VNEKRIGEHVAQKTETRYNRAECRRLREDIGKLDLQQIARDRTLDKHGTGQRMHHPRLDRSKIGSLHAGFDLTVERVARLQRDLLAFADLGHRRDIGVIAVVTEVRFFGQLPVSIDADRVHGPLLVQS